MKIIDLDAAGWITVLDFHRDLLHAIGAPEWHGLSINALVDSICYGGINEINPPFTIRIKGVSSLSAEIMDDINVVREEINAEHSVLWDLVV